LRRCKVSGFEFPRDAADIGRVIDPAFAKATGAVFSRRLSPIHAVVMQ
jgi:hypothetical protein